MAASSSFGGGSLHPASSAIEELQEELAVEQTILNSLDGVGPHEDVRRQIAESKEKIEKLKRRLAEARGSTPGNSNQTLCPFDSSPLTGNQAARDIQTQHLR